MCIAIWNIFMFLARDEQLFLNYFNFISFYKVFLILIYIAWKKIRRIFILF